MNIESKIIKNNYPNIEFEQKKTEYINLIKSQTFVQIDNILKNSLKEIDILEEAILSFLDERILKSKLADLKNENWDPVKLIEIIESKSFLIINNIYDTKNELIIPENNFSGCKITDKIMILKGFTE